MRFYVKQGCRATFVNFLNSRGLHDFPASSLPHGLDTEPRFLRPVLLHRRPKVPNASLLNALDNFERFGHDAECNGAPTHAPSFHSAQIVFAVLRHRTTRHPPIALLSSPFIAAALRMLSADLFLLAFFFLSLFFFRGARRYYSWHITSSFLVISFVFCSLSQCLFRFAFYRRATRLLTSGRTR